MPTSLDLHPAHSKTWNKLRSVARAKSTPTTFSQNVAPQWDVRLPSPKGPVSQRDAAEEHGDAGNDIWHARDAHLLLLLLVRRLREERHRDVLVLEQIRQPK